MANGDLQERVDAVRQLMRLFQPERIAYLIAAIVSLGVVVFFGVRLISGNPTIASLSAVVGSGGLISIGMGRLLTMWTQALRVVAGEKVEG